MMSVTRYPRYRIFNMFYKIKKLCTQYFLIFEVKKLGNAVTEPGNGCESKC